MKLVICSALVCLGLLGCSKNDDKVSAEVKVSTGDSDISSSLEKVGENLEDAAKKTQKNLEKGAEIAKEKLQEGAEKTGAGIKKAGEKIEETFKQ